VIDMVVLQPVLYFCC